MKMSEFPLSKIAFDIGGTFTDFVLYDGNRNKLKFWKTLSTTRDVSDAVASGIDQLLHDSSVSADEVGMILHATTVATNAILERKGVRTALITTKGFRDSILFGRQKRYDMGDLRLVRPAPLLRRRDIFEIDERIAFDGSVLRAPSEQGIAELVAALKDGAYEAVAVSLIHAYANPTHERQVARAVMDVIPQASVCLSSTVSPKYREYERTSTTVANAYIQPILKKYIDRVTDILKERALRPSLMIMQSNGGLVSPDLAKDTPIRVVESGPAAGVLMCRAVGRQEGQFNLLTFDMGGTTAKLGAIDNGEAATLSNFEVDQVRYTKGSGLPLNISAIEMLEIGAGGGSIAHLDLGTIVVGPESAGSDPGPICYGRGGKVPTVTDANAVLGYLNPEFFNGGRMSLVVDAAAKGIETAIGEVTGLSLAEAAWSIHRMATANMERALRIVSVERGRDPRRYALVGFGGAGPIHAARLARQVGIPTVIIPFGAGLGSAIGLLQAVPKLDHSITHVARLSAGVEAASRRMKGELDAWADTALAQVGNEAGNLASRRYGVTARYIGQGHEVPVDLPSFDLSEEAFIEQLGDRFRAAYKKLYGFTDTVRPVEIIDWSITVTVSGSVDHGSVSFQPGKQKDLPPRTRQAYFPEKGGYVDCSIFNRYALREGEEVVGPAIIEESESTIVILPGDRAVVSPNGNIIITIFQKDAP